MGKQQTFYDPQFGHWAILTADKHVKFSDKKENFLSEQDWSHESEKKIINGLKGAGFVKRRYIH